MKKINLVKYGFIRDAEQDLIDLYNTCMAYDAEYENEILTIVWPSIVELAAARHNEIKARQAELEIVKRAFTLEVFIKMTDYEAKWFKSALDDLIHHANPEGTDEEWAQRVYKTPYSRSYLRNPNYYCQPSYCYNNCMKYLTKYLPD